MKKTKNISIEVQGTPVSILSCKEGDYISEFDHDNSRVSDNHMSENLKLICIHL